MEERQSKIVLFSEDHNTVQVLENFFGKMVQLNCSIDLCPIKISTEEIFLRYTPDLIFIDFASMTLESREYIMSKLERVSEMIPLIALLDEPQKPDVLMYIKRGIRDVLELPIKENDVTKIIQRFRKDVARTPLKKMGRAYTFFSFKGGVGNTFMTINTAVAMARTTNKKVLLWDMALQAGDIPFFLNFQPEYTLSDLIDNIESIDQTYLEGVLPVHPCGVSILPAPVKIEDIEKLTPELLEKIMGLFLQHFDYIFIDGGYRLTDSLIPLIDASSYLFITTTLELIALRSASRCLDILEKLNYPADKIKIVVNRFSSKHEALTLDKARKILRFDLVHFMPNDYEIAVKSVNIGQSVMDAAKGSNLEKQFVEFAGKIESNFSEKKKATAKIMTRLTQPFFKKASNNVSQ